MDLANDFLDGCKEVFETGNKWALMQAIWVCALERRPMPDWVSQSYVKAYEDCRTAKVKSWDDVFGKPYPKGSHHNAINKRQTKQWELYHRILEIKLDKPQTKIDEALFETVGKEFGIGKTLASEFYYDAKKKLQED